MIIFRLKLFRRDEFPESDYDIIKPDPKILNELGGIEIKISTEEKYDKSISKLGIKGSPNRKKLDALKKDIKNLYLSFDGPAGGDTHPLGDYSKPGKFYVFSKSITDVHRLNYRVYPPEVVISEDKKTKSYIQRVVLLSCYDHEVSEGNYLTDKNLRARKDRMRKNAPYRKNSKSVMSKNKKRISGVSRGMNIKRLRK